MSAAEQWNGNVLGGERPRNEADAYFTPDELALAICRRLADVIDPPDLVVEPSAGAGALVRAVRATWEPELVIAVEPTPGPELVEAIGTPSCIYTHAWEETVLAPWHWSTLVVGNPPYNLPEDRAKQRRDKTAPTTAERHVRLALERLPDGGHLAFLLRLAFFGGGGRIDRLYAEHPLFALWPVTPRPSFTGGGSDNSEYGVFVWRKGYQGPTDTRPLRWRISR